jgi:hypothetical protein
LTPSITPTYSPTPVPPTVTPTPTFDPKLCNDNPRHPHYCTPTPSE